MKKLFRTLFLSLVAIPAIAMTSSEDRRLGLLEFTVVQNGTKTDIKWSLNRLPVGTYFTIEKSEDGKAFSKVIDVPVAESGNVFEEYFETDYQPYKDVTFYRIRQVDESGQAYYSETLSVKFNEEQTQRSYSSLPKNDATIAAVQNAEGKQALFVLRDMDGNDHYSVINLVEDDNHLVAYNANPKLPVGIYRIVGASNNQLYSLKLVVK